MSQCRYLIEEEGIDVNLRSALAVRTESWHCFGCCAVACRFSVKVYTQTQAGCLGHAGIAGTVCPSITHASQVADLNKTSWACSHPRRLPVARLQQQCKPTLDVPVVRLPCLTLLCLRLSLLIAFCTTSMRLPGA